MSSRRGFITKAVALGSVVYLPSILESMGMDKTTKTQGIHCQQYPWFTFFQREDKGWSDDLGYSMGKLAEVGFSGFEPSFASVEEVSGLEPFLKKYGIPTRSLYVNSVLHEENQTVQSIAEALEIAKAAKPLGVKILVTNPSPIRWGGDEDKTDAQLVVQARALDELGKKLREIGLTLAYHTHDAEMRNSAREFHHMLMATDPQNVKLCLDAHWIFRGSGNSQVALFDIVDMYMDRIVELHLRQSKNAIWTEAFTEGDIDYSRLSDKLCASKVKPHVVLEQAVEDASPNTMDAVEAHKLGLEYTKEVFKDLLN